MPGIEPVLVSACLLGQPVRYHGRAVDGDDAVLARWQAEGRVVAICPEVAGGLPTPRPPAEIAGGATGEHVLRHSARVMDNTGADVTHAFLDGAQQALMLARRHGVRVAVLKEGSPSCGSGFIYDGSFRGRRIGAPGVTAAHFIEAGIHVFSEHQFAQADALLQSLDVCR